LYGRYVLDSSSNRSSKAEGLNKGGQVLGDGAYRPSTQLRDLWERWELLWYFPVDKNFFGEFGFFI